MNKFNTVIIVFFLCLSLNGVRGEVKGEVNKTRETVDHIITWGVGISGGLSMLLCSNVDGTKPYPVSFYMFNLAAVGYWAFEQFMDAENDKNSAEIEKRDYGASNDAQATTYLKGRDLALLNEQDAKNKGNYKLAMSVVMLGAAALSLNERSRYNNSVEEAKNKTRAVCASGSTASKPLVISTYKEARCNNIGGGKMTCRDSEEEQIKKLKKYCDKIAESILLESECINLEDLDAAMKKAENEGKFEKDDLEDSIDLAEVEAVDVAAKSGFFYTTLTDNPVTRLLTLGGLQYSPGVRGFTYGALALIVGTNALANNSAALKYKDEADQYQRLYDGFADCGEGDCHSGEGGSTDGDGDNHSVPSNDTYGSVCYTGGSSTLSASDVVSWSVSDPASWNVSSSLEVNFHSGGIVHYGYPGGLNWPNKNGVTGTAICSQSGGDRINSTIWFIIKKADGWHAKSWDWTSICSPSPGWSVKQMQGPPSSMCECKFGFMTGGLYNAGVKERSEIVLKRWPESICGN